MSYLFKNCIFTFVFFFTTVISASAATYYVSPTGSDCSTCGSSTAPFQTIQKAANIVNAGDVVMVMPGTYNGSISTSRGGNSTAGRVRFVSQQPWGAKIRTSGSTYIWTNYVDYINIEGFDISGDAIIGILNYASHTKILGNHVHDLGRADCGTYGTGDMGSAIDTAGSGNVSPRDATDNDIIGNSVHDLSFACPSVPGIPGQHGIYQGYGSGVIANNIIYRVNSYPIHLYHHPYNVDVVNNLVFNSGSAGLIMGSDGGNTIHDIYVANNIFYGNTGPGIMMYGLGSGSSNISYMNNLLYNNTKPYDYLYGGAASLVTIAGDVQSDPQFVNYQANGSGDYHLKSTSPAIDKGISYSKISTDFDNAPRPQGAAFDIGAYEYGGATPPPSGASVSVDSTFSGYTLTPIDDGVINASGGTTSTWASADNTLAHWIQFNFTSPQQINTASIFWAFNTAQNKYMTSQRVDVQSWNGSAWVTLGSMTYSGDIASSSINFPAVTTSQLRFFQPANLGNPTYNTVFWVTEVEYGNRAVSVDSTYSGYTTNPIDDEVINASGGTATTWASSDNSLDHWIQIDFGSQKTQLNSATISWAFNTSQNKYMTSQRVDVQSWNGTAWITLGSTTYSGDVASSSVTFPAVTTSRIRFFQPANMGNPTYTGIFWVTEVDYKNSPSVLSPPSFSPNGGTFSAPVSVTLSASSGASIYYTTDGSIPTSSSSLYVSPITLTSTTTLKAIAVKTGMTTSPVASATFTVNIPGTLNLSVAPVLTWSTTNMTTCTASGGWTGPEPINGTASLGTMNSSQTLTLTCTGPGGTVQKSWDLIPH